MKNKRTLVAGIGYSHLSDLSVGPVLADRLVREAWPEHISVYDLSYGPVAVVQTLEEAAPPFERIVFVAAVDRGATPGHISVYRWDGVLPDSAGIQARVAEAVTGVVNLDNLLIVARRFGALPHDVLVVEIQPSIQEFGLTFSDTIEAKLEELRRRVRALAEDEQAAARCPVTGLGGVVSVR